MAKSLAQFREDRERKLQLLMRYKRIMSEVEALHMMEMQLVQDAENLSSDLQNVQIHEPFTPKPFAFEQMSSQFDLYDGPFRLTAWDQGTNTATIAQGYVFAGDCVMNTIPENEIVLSGDGVYWVYYYLYAEPSDGAFRHNGPFVVARPANIVGYIDPAPVPTFSSNIMIIAEVTLESGKLAQWRQIQWGTAFRVIQKIVDIDGNESYLMSGRAEFQGPIETNTTGTLFPDSEAKWLIEQLADRVGAINGGHWLVSTGSGWARIRFNDHGLQIL